MTHLQLSSGEAIPRADHSFPASETSEVFPGLFLGSQKSFYSTAKNDISILCRLLAKNVRWLCPAFPAFPMCWKFHSRSFDSGGYSPTPLTSRCMQQSWKGRKQSQWLSTWGADCHVVMSCPHQLFPFQLAYNYFEAWGCDTGNILKIKKKREREITIYLNCYLFLSVVF